MNSTVKTVVFWLVIVVSAFLLWQVVKGGNSGQKEKEVNFSEFMSEVDNGAVKEVTITGMEVHGKYTRQLRVSHHRSGQLSRHDQDAAGKGREHHHPRQQQRKLADLAAAICAPLICVGCLVVLHDPADADRRQQSALLRQEPGAAALHAAEEGHVQRRGRRG